MKIYYAGAEVSSHRKLLAECGIKTVSLSYVGLSRRVKFARPWLIADHFPEDQDIFLDSGAYSINRKAEEFTEEQVFDLSQRYTAFVTQNIDRVALVSEFDATMLGQDWIQAMREDFYDDLGDKFLPIWHSDTGREELERLSARYSHVGVLQVGAVDKQLLQSLGHQYGVKFHGVAMTQMEAMQEFRWDSVGSLSWLSPMTNGDTIIWTGRKLQRYPKKYKDSSRKRHRSWMTENGFDAALIAADDSKEVLRLSLWSWEHFVESINSRGVTTPAPADSGDIPETDPPSVDTPTPDSLTDELVPRGPVNRETQLLPIIGVKTRAIVQEGAEGQETEIELHTIEMQSKSLLQCDTCFMRDKCPGMRPHASCLYEIPVEVKTMPQRQAVWDATLQMQFQRVLRMQMIEQLEGGYADQNLSAELDRLTRMLKARSDSERSSFSFHAEGSAPADSGVLSRLFGREAGQGMSALPAPERAQDIIEAEIVGEDTVEGQ